MNISTFIPNAERITKTKHPVTMRKAGQMTFHRSNPRLEGFSLLGTLGVGIVLQFTTQVIATD